MLEEKMLKVDDEISLKLNLYEKGHVNWLIVTHGLGEHCLRHTHFIDSFSQNFNICFYDLRGHGSSDGKRAHIDDFTIYSQDLGKVIHFLKDNYLMTNYKLFGHSMGGLITCDFMQNFADPSFYPTSVFLSSPAVAPTGLLGSILSKEKFGLTKFLLKLPELMIEGILDIKKLSHDKRVYNDYIEDNKNSLKISSKLLFLIIERSKSVFSRKLNLNCPCYVIIGSGDVLVSPKACIDYFSSVEKQANLKIIDEAYHELHNEIHRYHEPYLEFLKESLVND